MLQNQDAAGGSPRRLCPPEARPTGEDGLQIHPTDEASPTGKVVPRWAWHRRMYDWMLSFSHTRHAVPALFVFSFAEASFFPLPPDILQIPMTLENPKKAWYYAFISTISSVLGGIAGYFIGYLFIGMAKWLFSENALEQAHKYFDNFWLLTGGSIVVHPYKLFTIAAGVFHVSLVLFIVASAIGRGLRFYLVAALLWKFGEPVRHFIERYFNILSIVLGLAIVGAFVAAKVL